MGRRLRLDSHSVHAIRSDTAPHPPTPPRPLRIRLPAAQTAPRRTHSAAPDSLLQQPRPLPRHFRPAGVHVPHTPNSTALALDISAKPPHIRSPAPPHPPHPPPPSAILPHLPSRRVASGVLGHGGGRALGRLGLGAGQLTHGLLVDSAWSHKDGY
jgi:hypothetical protein